LEELKKVVPCFHGELVRGAAVACPWEAAAAGARKAMADSGEWHRTAVALSLHRKFSFSDIFSGTSYGFGVEFSLFFERAKCRKYLSALVGILSFSPFLITTSFKLETDPWC
jgi:hypothetical protein